MKKLQEKQASELLIHALNSSVDEDVILNITGIVATVNAIENIKHYCNCYCTEFLKMDCGNEGFNDEQLKLVEELEDYYIKKLQGIDFRM